MLDRPAELRADRVDRRRGVRFGGRRLGLFANPAPAQKVDAPIVGDAKQPRRQRTRVVEGVELSIRLKKGLLNDILAVEDGSRHARAVAVQAGAKMRNRLEKREIPRLGR